MCVLGVLAFAQGQDRPAPPPEVERKVPLGRQIDEFEKIPLTEHDAKMAAVLCNAAEKCLSNAEKEIREQTEDKASVAIGVTLCYMRADMEMIKAQWQLDGKRLNDTEPDRAKRYRFRVKRNKKGAWEVLETKLKEEPTKNAPRDAAKPKEGDLSEKKAE